MLRVSDVWERALHTPGIAVSTPVNRGDVMTVAVVADTDPRERDGVVALDPPGHVAELNELPIAGQPHDPTPGKP